MNASVSLVVCDEINYIAYHCNRCGVSSYSPDTEYSTQVHAVSSLVSHETVEAGFNYSGMSLVEHRTQQDITKAMNTCLKHPHIM